MTHINEIEGIGAAYSEKLEGSGIKTVEGLLQAAATPKVANSWNRKPASVTTIFSGGSTRPTCSVFRAWRANMPNFWNPPASIPYWN
jgi:hypothetical protein